MVLAYEYTRMCYYTDLPAPQVHVGFSAKCLNFSLVEAKFQALDGVLGDGSCNERDRFVMI